MKLNHDWAFLNTPWPLNPIYTNTFTVRAKNNLKDKHIAVKIATDENNQNTLENFIAKQDSIRHINIKDFI